jgi:hypothetical protein
MTAARAKPSLRPLKPEESNLLRWILEHGSEDNRSFLPQLDGIRGARSCGCGCPSVLLEPLETAPLVTVKEERIIGDFVGTTAKDESVGVILFQDDGKLSELEIYPFSDFENKMPDSNFPLIESLKQF